LQQGNNFCFIIYWQGDLPLQPMKFFAFIMAFLVLALSIMPCADKDNAINAGKTEITKASNHQGDLQQDNCSPFCQCACCAGFSINHFIASITITESYKNKKQAVFLPADILDIALPIWQPPQLV